MAQRTGSMSEVAAQLRELPTVGLDGGWPAVATRMQLRRRRDLIRLRAGAVAALAMLGTLALLVGSRLAEAPQGPRPLHAAESAPTGSNETTTIDASVVAGAAELGSLRARSLALEELLARLPERPAVGRAGSSVPVDELEAQIQWLDHQLSQAAADPASKIAVNMNAERLWRERNDTLDALLLLRYAEIQSQTL